ncbi:phosphate signaling complex protein PhoU [Beggiatoa leptomitoformis]|uniref:Phosphate-specific transport system accessory protein PhoU n=1 Tax=Beggiatoa leptomitoformis TaxID=288004 RepID=A0A2N9YHF7_9GAMM|nr:phosphate signaling complex protein PhoU [Beggiatoa leptomitoformis]ALG67764.1 phosphate signaling complex protein PhoU [Beggiatoa leptomitoformis]AUI69991.1 phosphate signaling complex protein PhoU [Beggiatoa leptomitoformis]
MMEETEHHISQQFNQELRELRNQVLSMGGLVEEQLLNALTALVECDIQLAKRVYNSDYKINALEVAIDEDCSRIIARRQPAASDLRLLITVIKTIGDLERIGDEAERIAQMAMQEAEESPSRYFVAINHFGNHVKQMLHDALDAFARMDVDAALHVIREDLKVDNEYDSVSRQLMTYMMEDTRSIPLVMDIMWAARALERVAAHSRNVCEYVIYFVRGKDVRHVSVDKIEEVARVPK